MQKEEIYSENQNSFSTSDLWRKYKTLYTQIKKCNLDSPTLLRAALMGWIAFVQKYFSNEIQTNQADDNKNQSQLQENYIEKEMTDAIQNAVLDNQQEKLLDDAIQEKLQEVSTKNILSSYDHLRWIMQKYIQNYNQHSLKKITEYENQIKLNNVAQCNGEEVIAPIENRKNSFQAIQVSQQQKSKQQKSMKEYAQQQPINQQQQQNIQAKQNISNSQEIQNISQKSSSDDNQAIYKMMSQENPPLQQARDQKHFNIKKPLKITKKQEFFDPQPYESMKQLKKNPYLKMMFKQLCQQCLGRGSKPTFDQIAFASQTMNLNKWMVFCKQFDFYPKVSKNELVDTFKQVTNHLSQMNYQHFLEAIYQVQQKLKMNSKQFIKESLRADSFDAYRNKMNNLKIQYFGPRTNFFIQSQITANQKKTNELKYIPIKGMSQEHIQREIQYRKQNRKNKNLNRSILTPIIGTYKTEATPKQTARRYYHVLNDQTSYKQIFQTKRTTKSTLQSNSFKLNKIVQKAKMQVDVQSNLPQQNKIAKSMVYSSTKDNQFGNKQYHNPQIYLISQTVQAYDIDSDAQSDQILRQHYKMEKKVDPNMMLSRIYEKLKTNQQQQGQFAKFETEVIDDEDQNLLITQYR